METIYKIEAIAIALFCIAIATPYIAYCLSSKGDKPFPKNPYNKELNK